MDWCERPQLGKTPAGGLEPWTFRAAAAWEKSPRGDLNRGLFGRPFFAETPAGLGKKRMRGDLNRGLFERPPLEKKAHGGT